MINSYFDADLIRHYDQASPLYTSYPTAVAFAPLSTDTYIEQARLSNEDLIPLPLSLYVHLPFSDTVSFYRTWNKIVIKQPAQADRYLSYLYREIELQAQLYDPDRLVEQLHWGGGTPTFLNHRQITGLMQKLDQHFALDHSDRRDYSIEIEPRSVSTDTITLLSEIGFNRYSLGVQDLDEQVQRAISCIQPVQQTLDIIKACRAQAARSINLDLIYGLPLQTVTHFQKTLDTVLELDPDQISLFNYAHLPPLFKPKRRISPDDLPTADEKLLILQRSVEHLAQAGYMYIGMDKFAKPEDELVLAQRTGYLHRNLQGYTTRAHCDLVAMGVSAISNVADCYSQNKKTLASYYAALDNQRLPVSRGIVLDEDTALRRALIQQLSCYFELNIAAFETQHDIVFAEYFAVELVALTQMAADGLLSLSTNYLTVSEQGRFLVHVICTVFDITLRKKSTEQRFSNFF